ncbi:sugar phosphate isomerase/epimerase family protein [Clostridium beijerinckii]|uniref:D-tagatose 3-epimerase n=1 Tax=Clostridium beijerinckii TaxID=1520 RepID=A0A1S8S3K0_CLOBE|nr:sugar phosphate isomerase/epimerase [Clostridium beijerinckii]NRY60636.1 protein FrlC [Clostridium beijerinckii]OOM60036.1 D-tagatose 3-epimerase [Clostridium beijerinckii]
MKYVAMNFHYVRYPLSTFLDKVERSFFEYVELWAAAPHFNIYDATMADAAALKKEIKKRNLKLACVTPEQCVYPVNLAIQDAQLRNNSIEYFKKTIEVAEALETSRVIVSAGYGFFNQPKEEAWKLAKESLSVLSQFAKGKGITLTLEPLMVTTSNVINSSSDLSSMIDEVNSPNLVGMLDTSQMSFYPETPKEYFKNLGDKLQYLHFNDRSHLVPGDGDLPMKDHYKQIVENGYDGFCSFEICDRRYYCDPDAALDSIENWIKSNKF